VTEPTPALNALRAKLDGALSSLISDEAKRIGNGAGHDDTFGLSDEHQALAKAVGKFVRDELVPLRARITELEQLVKEASKYRGVWDAQKVYRASDCVTCAGVLWHAGEASVGQHPGEGQTAWKLMHKTKGRL
jgi:hypothetical protein